MFSSGQVVFSKMLPKMYRTKTKSVMLLKQFTKKLQNSPSQINAFFGTLKSIGSYASCLILAV